MIALTTATVYADDLQGGYNPFDRKNYKDIFGMLKPLAEQGNATAQYRLGQLYFLGRGVSKDTQEAVKWFRRAVGQGVPEAQLSLGVSYFAGVDMPKDITQAYKWFRIAGANGNKDAQKKMGIDILMTLAQIAEAQRLAKEWMEEHDKE